MIEIRDACDAVIKQLEANARAARLNSALIDRLAILRDTHSALQRVGLAIDACALEFDIPLMEDFEELIEGRANA